MEYENKQREAVDLLCEALSMINHIPEEQYRYIPELIDRASIAIFGAKDIIANDLVEKE